MTESQGPKPPAPDLLAAVGVSVARTQRGRYFWAAWWTHAPRLSPFQKPDASDGGAQTEEEAHARAEAVAGRSLTRIDGYWAHACNRMLRGEAPPPRPTRRKPPALVSLDDAQGASAWAVLGLTPAASLQDVKQAYRAKALVAHPDHGGDAAAFRELTRAYEKLVARIAKRRPMRANKTET